MALGKALEHCPDASTTPVLLFIVFQLPRSLHASIVSFLLDAIWQNQSFAASAQLVSSKVQSKHI